MEALRSLFHQGRHNQGCDDHGPGPVRACLGHEGVQQAGDGKAKSATWWSQLQVGQAETAQSGTVKASSASAVGSAYRAKKRDSRLFEAEAKASMVRILPQDAARARVRGSSTFFSEILGFF